jgi:hypothetical protein
MFVMKNDTIKKITKTNSVKLLLFYSDLVILQLYSIQTCIKKIDSIQIYICIYAERPCNIPSRYEF